MTPEQINRVFGRGRLQMVTGAHVEVFREAAAPGESRRYTKRFLTTAECDYAQWTEREWRILARLIGHGTRCVPDVVQYDRGAHGTKLVQTYDAGATVDQWATLLPVERDGFVHSRVFDDCAHWWALAHQCLVALDEIHTIGLVHLDIKGDNICIPIGPSDFDPASAERTLFPVFHKLALIDFAFSLVCGESLAMPLPIGWQQDYDYQSPLLLRALEEGRTGDLGATENLDWRCDMYSLAAMLKRYLPREDQLYRADIACGWTAERYHAAKSLILRIRDAHDLPLPARRPHTELIEQTSEQLRADELARSLERGWSLARDAQAAATPALPLTPVTRLAPPTRIVIPAREDLIAVRRSGRARESSRPAFNGRSAKPRRGATLLAITATAAAFAIAGALTSDTGWLDDAAQRIADTSAAAQSVLRRLEHVDSATASNAARAGTDDPHRGSAPAAAGSAAHEAADADVEQPSVATNEEAPLESPASSQTSDASAVATSTPAAPEASQPPTQAWPEPNAPPASGPPTSAAPVVADARDTRLKAQPPQKSPRMARPARAQWPSKPTAHAQRTRPAETRPSRLAAASKSKSATNLAHANTPRAPQTVAKKSVADPTVAIQRTPQSSPPTIVASTAESRPAAVATTPQTAIVAAAPSVSVPIASVAATQNTGAPSSPPIVSAASAPHLPPEAQVATAQSSPPSPPVQKIVPAPEPLRPPAASASAAAPLPSRATVIAASPPMAPVVELSRPLATPAFPAPRPMIPAEPARTRPPLAEGDDLLAQARWNLGNLVPRTAERARLRIARAMYIAANANHPWQERFVVDAVVLTGSGADIRVAPREIAGADARRLHDEATRAYASRRVAADAIDLELRAFGANPYDPEIAGQLALFYLRTSPAQPERARDLALHAIGTASAANPRGRVDDWITFAIASALTGRQADSTNALYVSVALARNDERICRAALGALSMHGERLREPVESLLYRLQAQRRDDDSPSCAWPRSRLAGMPYPW